MAVSIFLIVLPSSQIVFSGLGLRPQATENVCVLEIVVQVCGSSVLLDTTLHFVSCICWLVWLCLWVLLLNGVCVCIFIFLSFFTAWCLLGIDPIYRCWPLLHGGAKQCGRNFFVTTGFAGSSGVWSSLHICSSAVFKVAKVHFSSSSLVAWFTHARCLCDRKLFG